MLFVRTRLCDPAKKLAKIVEKFDEKTSSFPSKFRPRNPIPVEKSMIRLVVFIENFVSKAHFDTKLDGWPPAGDEIFDDFTNAFSSKFVPISSPEMHFVYEIHSQIAFRIRMEISYDEGFVYEIFGTETFVSPPETKFRYRNVKNASKVSYTNGEFRIRNEDFVYEMKA